MPNRESGSSGGASSGGGGSWSSEQLQNARIIAQVGRRMGMSSRDIQIALMAALQESGLRNLSYGDRDSLGLFQQRAGWGSASQRMNPTYAATQFYKHLAGISNRNSLELWQAAQKVQISAFPHAYAKWENNARALMGELGTAGRIDPSEDSYVLNSSGGWQPRQDNGMGLLPMPNMPTPWASQAEPMAFTQPKSTQDNPLASAMDKILDDGIGGSQTPGAGAPEALGTEAADKAIDWSKWAPQDALMQDAVGVQGGPLDNAALPGGQASGLRSAVLNYAKSFIGRPYVWGAAGPSGFDCSGLVQYALKHMGVSVPRLAYQQANFGQQTSLKNIQAGDLVFWGNSRRTQGNHIAFYLGNGMILEAPRPGLSVRIRKLGGWDKDDSAVGVKLNY